MLCMFCLDSGEVMLSMIGFCCLVVLKLVSWWVMYVLCWLVSFGYCGLVELLLMLW